MAKNLTLPAPLDHHYCRSPGPSSVLVDKHITSSEMEEQNETEGCQSPLRSLSSIGDRITTLDDVEANLYALTKLVTNVAAEVRLIFNVVCGGSDTVQRSLEFSRIENEEAFKEFDDKLRNNSIYMAEIVTKFLHLLKLVNDIDRRLCIMLDLVFDRAFLTLCSWTGAGIGRSKICFKEFEHVICLFKIVGGNSFIRVTDELIKSFFQKKLNNGKSRLIQMETSEASRKRKILE
ncbi:uncharacterized protein LOC128712602 [Anopheles marshallii]|uniref:uncharacterized protein LOC128712602 n=1 Tax=Anopheles marshallii TaxID=1521116 RepID=UPI00237AA809|nr:uncharacterized protein LOC128712602 [Anopheles marshallii]